MNKETEYRFIFRYEALRFLRFCLHNEVGLTSLRVGQYLETIGDKVYKKDGRTKTQIRVSLGDIKFMCREKMIKLVE